MRAFHSIACLVVIVGVADIAQSGTASEPLPSRVTPVVIAARKAGPAVVSVSTERVVEPQTPDWGIPGLPFNDLFDWPRGPVKQTGLGSGAIVAETGYIITNAHVVEGAQVIRVALADDKRYDARLISSDPANDLAVIKIDAPAPLPFIEMGTSSDLMPGETVVALGNPFGFGHTVTAGVVSAVKRDLVIGGKTVYPDLIQTDAAINPGSSGGPLVNVYGQLVGIDTAIRTQAENIGFAIPVDRVRQALMDLLDFRTLNHTWLGITFAETRQDGPPVSYVVAVHGIDAKGPAAGAGLDEGDQILSLDGRRVQSLIDFKARLLEKKAGETVALTLVRGGKRRSAQVKLVEAPRKPGRDLARDRLGLVVDDLTPEIVKNQNLPVKEGLLVTQVLARSPAAEAGIQKGDVLFQAGTYRVQHAEELAPILDPLRKGQTIRIGVVRAKFLVWLRVAVK